MVALSELYTAITNAQSVYAFIDQGAFYNLLQTIGDKSYNAAISSLRDFNNAKNKEALVRESIPNFRNAYEYYKDIRKSYYAKYTNLAGWLYALDMEVFTCLMISICYKYVREEKLSSNWISLAYEPAIKLYESSRMDNIGAAVTNIITPMGIFNSLKESSSTIIKTGKLHRTYASKTGRLKNIEYISDIINQS